MSSTDHLGALVNLRDLGGQPTDDGVLTRPGVVYRSDAPRSGDRDPEGLEKWPPHVVVDLREDDELLGRAHPMADVTEVRRVPVLTDLPRSAPDTSDELSVFYQRMVRQAADKLVEVFRIAVEADGPVLVHCAAGKDRTGVVSAMLLSAAGVLPDAIVADYARTDKNMYRVLQRLNLAPSLPPGVTEDIVADLMAAPIEAIQGVIAEFGEHPGAAAGWLRSHGVTSAELGRWHDKFLAG
ncbi:tyrosine-protein phosphatase [Saccharopolyspora griseoalba]|uniref:Tyrosine-protein phosphatase n=1 Tax=Saccharopolyspora griseoalba TaxID=1431848 RepID=A0ABW2LND9_9PSEU